jgi:hypothetical protein
MSFCGWKSQACYLAQRIHYVGEVAAPRQRLGRVAHARFDEGSHRLSRLLDKARHVLREPLRIADLETESPRRLH